MMKSGSFLAAAFFLIAGLSAPVAAVERGYEVGNAAGGLRLSPEGKVLLVDFFEAGMFLQDTGKTSQLGVDAYKENLWVLNRIQTRLVIPAPHVLLAKKLAHIGSIDQELASQLVFSLASSLKWQLVSDLSPTPDLLQSFLSEPLLQPFKPIQLATRLAYLIRINAKVWPRSIPMDHQVGLLMHEALYKIGYLPPEGVPNSVVRKVRQLNACLLTPPQQKPASYCPPHPWNVKELVMQP